MDDNERVELLRMHDPLRAQMIRELLEGEGIAVATPGLEHRAMWGIVGHFVEIVIKVPRGDLERARELIAGLEARPNDPLPDAYDEEVATAGYRTPARRATSTLGGKRRRIA